jgi:hypothetical protein
MSEPSERLNEELRRKIEEFEKEVERGERVKREICEVLKEAGFVDSFQSVSTAVVEALAGVDPILFDLINDLIRGSGDVLEAFGILLQRSSEFERLQKLLELAKELTIPRAPSTLSELELEVPLDKLTVRIKELRIERGGLYVTYEVNGKERMAKVTNHTVIDLPYLLPYPHVRKFLEEAIDRYKTYNSQLEELKKDLTLRYSKEILAREL